MSLETMIDSLSEETQKKILVNEIFGPTIQGEGPSLGTPCSFLRVAACNQHCVWCDTYYTWDWQRVNKEDEVHPMDVNDVYKALKAVTPAKRDLLVISGGEPMLQQARLIPLLELVLSDGLFLKVEVETAGTIAPKPDFTRLIDQFNVSLKLEHSGNEKSLRYRPLAIDALMATDKAAWKFVVKEPEDFPEIDQIVDFHKLGPIYVMPEGVTPEALSKHAKAVFPEVIKRGWRMTPRLHIELWGQERGH